MESWLVEIVVGPDTARDEARRVRLRLVAISAGDRMKAGVSRGGKAPRGLVVGRLLDGFDKEIAGAGRWIEKFWLSGMNPSPKPAH